MYKAPIDGYVLAQTWNNDSTVVIWIGAATLRIELTNDKRNSYALPLAKGMKVWIGGSGTNRTAYFFRLEV